MRETGYDDVISNRCSIYGHGRQFVMDWQLRLLGLTINLHRIDARNSPKQAKNEMLQKKIILSACASIYRGICLSRRETVRLNWKPWVSQQNRETWEVCKFNKQPWPEYHMINYFLTELAQAILRNIAPWSFLYGPRCAPSLVPQCSTNIPQYGPPARLVRA